MRHIIYIVGNIEEFMHDKNTGELMWQCGLLKSVIMKSMHLAMYGFMSRRLGAIANKIVRTSTILARWQKCAQPFRYLAFMKYHMPRQINGSMNAVRVLLMTTNTAKQYVITYFYSNDQRHFVPAHIVGSIWKTIRSISIKCIEFLYVLLMHFQVESVLCLVK